VTSKLQKIEKARANLGRALVRFCSALMNLGTAGETLRVGEKSAALLLCIALANETSDSNLRAELWHCVRWLDGGGT